VREVETIIDTDHLSIHWLDDGYSIMAAHMGATYQALDAVSFAHGPGVEGWLSVGAPELNMIDISKDARCNSEVSLKMRIGSLCVVPIQFSDKPFGFVCATTCRTGGLDTPEIETLRVVAAEMGQALARLRSAGEPQAGLMTPREFQQRVQEQGEGCIVALETLRKKQLSETFGRPAIEHAQRQLALRIRSKLPSGGCICRRSQGDYAVYLPGCDEPFARSWANEIAALASMIGLRTPDGKSRIPLAVRGKAAKIEKTQQIVEEVGS
jgi:GGDEF domain-containing protein